MLQNSKQKKVPTSDFLSANNSRSYSCSRSQKCISKLQMKEQS